VAAATKVAPPVRAWPVVSVMVALLNFVQQEATAPAAA